MIYGPNFSRFNLCWKITQSENSNDVLPALETLSGNTKLIGSIRVFIESF